MRAADLAWRSAAIALCAIVVAVFSCCKPDRCQGEPPAFELALTMPTSASLGVATLRVEVAAAGLTKSTDLDAAPMLAGGGGSVVVLVGDAGRGGFEATVTVKAMTSAGAVVTQGQQRFTAAGNSCNFFSMRLDATSSDGGHAEPATCKVDSDCKAPADCAVGKCGPTGCGYAFKPAGTICRASTGPCDPAEVCSGSSIVCPTTDVKYDVRNDSFKTAFGNDGFASSNGVLGYQRVEAACNSGKLTRGFISFDTSALPKAAKVIEANLAGCWDAANGVDKAQLFTVSFTPPLAAAHYDAPATYLMDLPDGAGMVTFQVNASTVKPQALTQYSMRYPVTNCPSDWAGRVWSSSDFPGSTNCPAKTPWTLAVRYCVPP